MHHPASDCWHLHSKHTPHRPRTIGMLDHARGLEALHKLALSSHGCRRRGKEAVQLLPLRVRRALN